MNDSVPKSSDANALVETTHVRADNRDLLGKPPLLANEDPNEYDALLDALASEVNPKDFIERLWVKDVADHTWEILRYRRIKAAYVNGQSNARLSGHLPPEARSPHMSWMSMLEAARKKPVLARAKANRVANDYVIDPKTKEEVDATVKAQGLDADTLVAESFVAALGPLEAIERMLASAEHRRNNALREIERRRSALGRALHEASNKIIEPLVPLAAE